MANPLFNLLNQNNMLGILSQLKQNPMTVLQKAGLNIPTNLSNPTEILNHLVRSGQINQAQLNQAQQMAQMFGNMK